MQIPGQPVTQTSTPRGRLARRFSVATATQTQRRRVATLLAVVVAGMLGYHALFGANGVLAYGAKRQEHRVLAQKLEQMRQENSRLKMHVDHLKSDPDAIEYEAHTRLRYTRPDQVIVLNNTPESANPQNATPEAPRSGSRVPSGAQKP